MQKLLTKDGGQQKNKIVPCCSPTQLAPLQLLYIDTNNTITQKTLPNMVVEACGCMWYRCPEGQRVSRITTVSDAKKTRINISCHLVRDFCSLIVVKLNLVECSRNPFILIWTWRNQWKRSNDRCFEIVGD